MNVQVHVTEIPSFCFGYSHPSGELRTRPGTSCRYGLPLRGTDVNFFILHIVIIIHTS